VLSEEDQSRTHVFSSFFYKRLTTRPAKALRRSHPVEDDPKLSPAEKRHSRVKGWTKNINIFEKDFIIIPINEQ
jgi:sentrin-specific protease 7